MKTSSAVTLAIILALMTIGFAEVCKNNNNWCHYMVRYGACAWNNGTNTTCPRSCGICQVSCPNIKAEDRQECGYYGITQQNCFHAGCCWGPLEHNSVEPWCYKPAERNQAIRSAEDLLADDVCEDAIQDCHHHTRYGACNFNNFTRSNCKKSCKLC